MRKQFAETEITWGTTNNDDLVNAIAFDAYGNNIFVATQSKLRVHAAKKWQDCQAEVGHDGHTNWVFSE